MAGITDRTPEPKRKSLSPHFTSVASLLSVSNWGLLETTKITISKMDNTKTTKPQNTIRTPLETTCSYNTLVFYILLF